MSQPLAEQLPRAVGSAERNLRVLLDAMLASAGIDFAQ